MVSVMHLILLIVCLLELTTCEESLFVKDAVVIDIPHRENCIWRVETDENYVLAFTLQGDGNFKRAQDFMDVSIVATLNIS
jgi:hypothetical protein